MVGLTPLQTILEMKFYFAHYVEGFVLLGKISLFLLIFINVNFFWGGGGGGGGKKTTHGYSKSDDHLIHLADIHRFYLIYFEKFSITKVV